METIIIMEGSKMGLSCLSRCSVSFEAPIVNEGKGFYENFYINQAEEILYDEKEEYAFMNEAETDKPETNILRKAFNNIIFIERIHQVAYNKALKKSNLKSEEDHVEKVFKQLQAELNTPEQKRLLTELEAAWNSMYAVFLEYSYCQGIADSRVIHRELEEYGICILKECA
ncbi:MULTISPECIES: hypothetical protein [Clostridia]|uniref:hypothetical protein n=1 Tax=Clostridia TaxID=186801 RepID=UPI000EA12B4D|nr:MULTISPECIES: hypothetical protein [Clostridia]NBJ71040.1 hypothetical protein [Roseburia sp. 1XD42-34]RKI75322.1 hypothetical protein D7V87_16490 [Clostridium sp. 1xD42-85]